MFSEEEAAFGRSTIQRGHRRRTRRGHGRGGQSRGSNGRQLRGCEGTRSWEREKLRACIYEYKYVDRKVVTYILLPTFCVMCNSVEFVLRSPFKWEVTDTSQSRSGLPPRQLPVFIQLTGPVPRRTRECL